MVEQAESLSPLLLARAQTVVAALAGTVAVMPAPAKSAAVPLPSGALVQVLLE